MGSSAANSTDCQRGPASVDAAAVAETINAVAARVLSETGIDMSAFGETLNAVKFENSHPQGSVTVQA